MTFIGLDLSRSADITGVSYWHPKKWRLVFWQSVTWSSLGRLQRVLGV